MMDTETHLCSYCNNFFAAEPGAFNRLSRHTRCPNCARNSKGDWGWDDEMVADKLKGMTW